MVLAAVLAVALDTRMRMCRQRCRRLDCSCRKPGSACVSKAPISRDGTDPTKAQRSGAPENEVGEQASTGKGGRKKEGDWLRAALRWITQRKKRRRLWAA
jgi:hypothetical protein